MKIGMNEIKDLQNYMGMDTMGEFISDIEENNSDYEDIIENIWIDYRHKIVEALREALYCGFDRDVLTIDCGISSDLVDLIMGFKDKKIEVEL